MTLIARRSRRAFIGQCAAVVSVATIIPSRAVAGRGGKSANERIGVGYIGVGRRANQLLDLPEPARVVAISDVHLPRAQEVAGRFGAAVYQDYRRLLDDDRVDAVVIAAPDHWHALASIHACQAGKDVYCEKPLSLTIREGRQMTDAARKHERVFQTGSHQRTMNVNRLACEFIRRGGLGKLQAVIGHNYPSPWECGLPEQAPPTGLDWNTWCGPAPARPFHQHLFTPRSQPGWISFRDYSGGEMTGWGAHGLDQIQWALGMDDSGPVAIWTEGKPLEVPTYRVPESRKRGEAACRHPTVFFRYASGVTVELADGPAGGGTFVGERGTISIDRGTVKTEPRELVTEIFGGDDRPRDIHEHHLQDWVDCMQSRAKPAADVEIGHRTATLCHLGNIARWVNRKLAWDPQREMFRDDEEANALASREQREGFRIPDDS
jgi:predicted dehydrogenase